MKNVKDTYQTQIQKLKEAGLYGSTGDPQWNPVTRRHDCCGAPRAYYHLKGCPLCSGGGPDDLSDLKDVA